ncbi:MAG: hypothetical protein CMM96_03195 [Rickettsiales bacterium]|nr:hypothetical protein [Rickettsiales bacterium]|tara:strand:- start:469 stop:651 length:183 start_codon:yes stop_codon:yes gene_type:complete
MKNKKLSLVDVNNKKFDVKNKIQFINHIKTFHASGTSFHEEDGHIIKIDDKLRELIKCYE